MNTNYEVSDDEQTIEDVFDAMTNHLLKARIDVIIAQFASIKIDATAGVDAHTLSYVEVEDAFDAMKAYKTNNDDDGGDTRSLEDGPSVCLQFRPQFMWIIFGTR